MIFFWMMNEADFLRIYETYKGLVYSICYNILQDGDLALEAANDTFVTVDQNYAKLRDKSKEKSWVARIAQYTALARRRTHIRANRLTDYDELPELANTNKFNPETIVIREETRKELLQAIYDLPPIYQDIFVFAYYYDMRVGEIAEMLGLSNDVVQKRLQRGRAKLRSILLGKGVVGNESLPNQSF